MQLPFQSIQLICERLHIFEVQIFSVTGVTLADKLYQETSHKLILLKQFLVEHTKLRNLSNRLIEISLPIKMDLKCNTYTVKCSGKQIFYKVVQPQVDSEHSFKRIFNGSILHETLSKIIYSIYVFSWVFHRQFLLFSSFP